MRSAGKTGIRTIRLEESSGVTCINKTDKYNTVIYKNILVLRKHELLSGKGQRRMRHTGTHREHDS